MQRVVIYELKDQRKEVFTIGNHPEAEQRERANAEHEMHDPKSHVVDFSFQWRPDTDGNGQHCWYE